jgi:formate dehydrogenase major subunit
MCNQHEALWMTYPAIASDQFIYERDKRENSMSEQQKLPLAVQSVLSDALEVGSRVQPFSKESLEKAPRIRDVKMVHSVCPYCAVGCGLNVYVKDGCVIDIEGNPDSPINHGTLCPKGSATFQYTINPSRLTHVLYRAPYSDHWESKTLAWAMEQIAQRVKQTRDETFVERLPDGREVNHTLGIASLGGATLDIEENYVIKKLFNGGLGIVSIENQARI